MASPEYILVSDLTAEVSLLRDKTGKEVHLENLCQLLRKAQKQCLEQIAGVASREALGNSGIISNVVQAVLPAALVKLRRNCCGEDVNFDEFETEIDLSDQYFIGIPDHEVLLLCVDLVRLLRNLSAGVCANQNRILRSMCLDQIMCCMKHYEKLSSGSENWKKSAQDFASIVTQLFCNVVSQNETAQKAVWASDYPVQLLSLFIEAKDYKLMKLACILIHYCSSSSSVRLSSIFLEKRPVFEMLMKTSSICEPQLFGILNDTKESDDDSDNGDDNDNKDERDAVLQVISWIMKNIIVGGHMIGTPSSQKHISLFESPSLIFLSHWLQFVTTAESNNDMEEVKTNATQSLALLRQLLSTKKSSDVTSHQENRNLALGTIMLSKILGIYTTLESSYPLNGDCTQLLSLVLTELKADSPYHGYKSELVRIVANACHLRKVNQDFVRTSGGLITILNCCNLDENNPYIREWAIFAIRNLTEDNEENQKVIAELRLQGAADMPIIDKAGMKVEMTADGKPIMVPKEKDSRKD
mmetsp:Transcript_6907/g.7892  ORF Transcript_6907/g.7892 Transcript_6907/m.7892 type:complete len:528 (+) Transcript_6907:92-1675(+)